MEGGGGASPSPAAREARAAEARRRAAQRKAERDAKRSEPAPPPSESAEEEARRQSRAATLAKLKQRSASQQGMAEIDQSDWLDVPSPRPSGGSARQLPVAAADGGDDGGGHLQHAISAPARSSVGWRPPQPPTSPSRPVPLDFQEVSTSRIGGSGVTVGWAITTGSGSAPIAPLGWNNSREWLWEAQYGKQVDRWHDAAQDDWSCQQAGGGWCGTVVGLVPGSWYSVRVRAHVDGVYGPWSKKSDLITAMKLTVAAPVQPESTSSVEADGSALSAMVSDVRMGEWEAALAHLKQYTHPDDEAGWEQQEPPLDEPTIGEKQRIVELVHLALSHAHVPLELVWRLLVAYPRAIQERLALPPVMDGRGADGGEGLELLPLQRGLFAAVSPGVLGVLLNPPDYTEAAARVISRERCEGRLLPLHIAAATHGTTTATLDALLESHAKATGEREENGLLALHIAIWNSMPLAIVQMLIDKTPGGHKSATSKDMDYMWPLHIAASVCVPRPLLEWLIEAEPKALNAKTRSGRNALHCALAPKVPALPEYPPLHCWEPTVDVLMDASPGLLLATDADGRTPLHLALWNGDPLPVIRKVLEKAEEAALERDSAGLTPLATAVGRGAELETVEVLIKVSPGATQIKSKTGSLPLHEAASAGARVEVLRALLGADVSTAAKPTAAGDLPLHLALDSIVNQSVAVAAAPYRYPMADFAEAAKCLAMAYPTAAAMPGSRGRRPFELAAECGSDEALQEMLYAMGDIGGGEPQGQAMPQSRAGTPQAARAPTQAAALAPAPQTPESREAAAINCVAAQMRLTEARIAGLKQEVTDWKAEADAREAEVQQGMVGAQAQVEREVAQAEARVAVIRQEAEQLGAAVEAMTDVLDDKEVEFEQLEEALEWQEDGVQA